MKSIATLNYELSDMAAKAAEVEQLGADVIAAGEFAHDPLFLMMMAATSTKKVKLMTGITVAFGRSPMTLATQAYDINHLSQGRFILGIGSQIKPHIERRYSMPWSKPAARMREYVMALKAIWSCWENGKPLDFQGEFYNHTLMTPMFTPADHRYGPPPVYVAAVGPLMTETAGEVADGVLLHSFITEEYVRDVTMPALMSGLKKSGRSRQDLTVVGGPFFVTGETEERFKERERLARKQIAFYGSTPAYRPVLESVGYGALQPELQKLSKENKWNEMASLVDDTLFEKIALVGEPEQIAEKLEQRYGTIIDLCSCSVMNGEAYDALEYHSVIGEIIKVS